ncbi:S-adenosyl-L-methionine-dependent methyltransferase [Coniophora puteana RWD-64-598 SS2]|uniref:S-adenosyl-L-methionine-dependent methyltransferase n=1 Tax=Coniophora puteana (strain RWD-64-598) TaxID=741705 RepID=A0A5M3N6N1_CONPW|nr:S-adenosyl-L-methionine-dependent methyltransferase [Coniophora puteana RWD-64-598 SS2]EIW87092.1 S-adenosyl-L-methionine-dependent methyltransferase [Coniophora puteana RWD-64-598 SS2]
MSWDFPSVASSRTSYDVSMRSASPTPSVVSVTSSFRAQAFRTEYGRGLNNYSEVYTLPADDEEIDRLNNQYLMFNEVIGKYPPPLPEVLAEDNLGGVPGEIKAVLDLGCGSGCWIMDIARQFPHCSAVAVDLVPMQSPDMPPNCRSEVDDINLGLEHFYGDFDVVHVQLVSSGIRDYQGLIDHISHVLRPGGLMELIEFPFAFTGADHVNIVRGPGEYGPPWAAQWMATARQAVMQRGGEADASGHLRQWVEDHPAFENVVYREYWFPCSPWLRGNDPQSAKWNRIGATMRDDIVAFMKGGRPLLLRSGLSEAFVDDLQTKAVNELMEGKEPVFVCIQNIYARKKTT